MRARPLAIDLYCGLGGWAEGFLSEGFDVIGFDIERRPYPGQLVIQDVLTLHGSQFKNAGVIVASPPCQAYSYRAMPWKRAKALPPPDNTLFDACFRIQKEACLAAGRYIPMVVENVKGAQPWVSRARWHYGSFYLWGDVPALMPVAGFIRKSESSCSPVLFRDREVPRFNNGEALLKATKNNGGSWFAVAHNTESGHGQNPDGRRIRVGVKNGNDWFGSGDDCPLQRRMSSRSEAGKAASAQIAKIPFALAQHIARVYRRSDSALGIAV